MKELPKRLEDRFGLYLNILPVVESVGLYGSLTLGLILSVIAVTQVALRASKYVASPYNQKYHHNLASNSVYNACEEKVTGKQNSAPNDSSTRSTDEMDDEEGNRNSDDDEYATECLNIIRRDDQYELEDDDALSDNDIAYNDDDDSNSTSAEQVCFNY